jgi:hypothetical protein
MKLHQVKSEPQNRRISNNECRRVGSLRSVIFHKIDRIPYFDIRHSTFDIHYSIFDIPFSGVSFLIRLAAFQARGAVRVKLHAEVSFSIRPATFQASGPPWRNT